MGQSAFSSGFVMVVILQPQCVATATLFCRRFGAASLGCQTKSINFARLGMHREFSRKVKRKVRLPPGSISKSEDDEVLHVFEDRNSIHQTPRPTAPQQDLWEKITTADIVVYDNTSTTFTRYLGFGIVGQFWTSTLFAGYSLMTSTAALEETMMLAGGVVGGAGLFLAAVRAVNDRLISRITVTTHKPDDGTERRVASITTVGLMAPSTRVVPVEHLKGERLEDTEYTTILAGFGGNNSTDSVQRKTYLMNVGRDDAWRHVCNVEALEAILAGASPAVTTSPEKQAQQ